MRKIIGGEIFFTFKQVLLEKRVETLLQLYGLIIYFKVNKDIKIKIKAM